MSKEQKPKPTWIKVRMKQTVIDEYKKALLYEHEDLNMSKDIKTHIRKTIRAWKTKTGQFD